MEHATLYIIATPIGNLADISLRALETLKEVDLILSEDTRETSKLLDKYNIKKPQISYRDQNHARVFGDILAHLEGGHTAALISDSGTPLISDPGFKLVTELIAHGVKVQALPGPSSVISALVVSGLPTDKFTFLGFLPKGPADRKKTLLEYGNASATLIVFESPFRVKKLLEEILGTLGNRRVAVVKDLTKVFEEVYRGTTQELLDRLSAKTLKGEYIVVIAKKDF